MFMEHRAGYQSLSVSLALSADADGLLWFGDQRLAEPYVDIHKHQGCRISAAKQAFMLVGGLLIILVKRV